MVNWQITATTIYCDAVDDEVTLLVYKDWSLKCTGYEKYASSRNNAIELAKKGRQLKRELACVGPECSRVLRYKEKLLSEEAKKG